MGEGHSVKAHVIIGEPKVKKVSKKKTTLAQPGTDPLGISDVTKPVVLDPADPKFFPSFENLIDVMELKIGGSKYAPTLSTEKGSDLITVAKGLAPVPELSGKCFFLQNACLGWKLVEYSGYTVLIPYEKEF